MSGVLHIPSHTVVFRRHSVYPSGGMPDLGMAIGLDMDQGLGAVSPLKFERLLLGL